MALKVNNAGMNCTSNLNSLATLQNQFTNCIFPSGGKTSAANSTSLGNPLQEDADNYLTNAINNGEVTFQKSFLNLSNSYNFKVGEDETLATFSRKMGLSPEMVMDNIIGGGSDLSCKAPMHPDGERYINISEKDLASVTGKSPQELHEMLSS